VTFKSSFAAGASPLETHGKVSELLAKQSKPSEQRSPRVRNRKRWIPT